MFGFLYRFFIDTGNAIVSTWLTVLLVTGLVFALARIFTHVKKIQSRKLRWPTIRSELMWSALNVASTAFVLKYLSSVLVSKGYLTTVASPAPWYIIAFEFMLYFFIFDLYFYTVHRLMHTESLYRWVHRIHHRSTTPNPLSSTSMSPIEGITEGLIIPLFLSVFTVHQASMALIIPFATVMGLYVHCGHEIVPRWWYKTWATKWLITPMFHDQHHQYFTCNYGGFTTIWDWVFGTVRNRFLHDFDKLRSKQMAVGETSEAA